MKTYKCFFDKSDSPFRQDYIAEVIPQTLDEYICSLPLEERAKYFMHYIPDLDFGDDWYGSSLFKNRSFLCYDEALQATIEALKQPKE